VRAFAQFSAESSSRNVDSVAKHAVNGGDELAISVSARVIDVGAGNDHDRDLLMIRFGSSTALNGTGRHASAGWRGKSGLLLTVAHRGDADNRMREK